MISLCECCLSFEHFNPFDQGPAIVFSEEKPILETWPETRCFGVGNLPMAEFHHNRIRLPSGHGMSRHEVVRSEASVLTVSAFLVFLFETMHCRFGIQKCHSSVKLPLFFGIPLAFDSF